MTLKMMMVMKKVMMMAAVITSKGPMEARRMMGTYRRRRRGGSMGLVSKESTETFEKCPVSSDKFIRNTLKNIYEIKIKSSLNIQKED